MLKGDRMKLEIPVKVDLNGIDSIVDEIKCLQTYRLSEGDDMVLVSLDDVAEILINHIEAKRKSEPQRMRGRWIRNDNGTYSCSVCQSWIPEEQHCYARYCLYCGADMKGEEDE